VVAEMQAAPLRVVATVEIRAALLRVAPGVAPQVESRQLVEVVVPAVSSQVVAPARLSKEAVGLAASSAAEQETLRAVPAGA
jgi:hypothetical protein